MYKFKVYYRAALPSCCKPQYITVSADNEGEAATCARQRHYDVYHVERV